MTDAQVAHVQSAEEDITDLLQRPPLASGSDSPANYSQEQEKDPEVLELRPPLHPIPVQRVFQIVGVDILDLPRTEAGNKHVVVFQDFLSKWPLVYPVPDQKAIHLARLLVEEVVPMFGVPKALLSDRGTCASFWESTSSTPPPTIPSVW